MWAAQQPIDKRVFDCDYDDVELLGKLVTRGDQWPLAGLALHAGTASGSDALPVTFSDGTTEDATVVAPGRPMFRKGADSAALSSTLEQIVRAARGAA